MEEALIVLHQLGAQLLFEIPIAFSESEDSETSDEEQEIMTIVMQKRKLYRPPRISSYVEQIVPGFTAKQFQQHFRITIEAYEYLLVTLGPQLIKEDVPGRPTINVEKQVLAVIWLLATPDSYRSVRERFDLAKSSLSACFVRVIKILSRLASEVITWPNHQQIEGITRKFKAIAGLSNVIGAIDGTFVPIKAPREHSEAYVTRKCNFSFTLQAICDPWLKFTDAFIAYPGSVSDIRIFRNSHIYNAIRNDLHHYFPQNQFILGDKAYPVLEWCIPPYIARGNLSAAQIHFNKIHAKTRQCIERSFALLFGRFRRLKYVDMNRTDLIPCTVISACVLHNTCLKYPDELAPEYICEGLNWVMNDDNNDGEPERIEGTTYRDHICRMLYQQRYRN